MKKPSKGTFAASALAAGLLIAPISDHARAQPDPQIVWLQSQQNSTTGLVDSYEGDATDRAYTYDQATATISFTHSGNLTDARQVLDRMAALQQSTGAWYTGYNARTGVPVEFSTHTGPIAWMAIALNQFEAATQDTIYLGAKRRALDLLESRMNTDQGNETYGAVRFDSSDFRIGTEHNHDAHSAFRCAAALEEDAEARTQYRGLSRMILDYLRREMWARSTYSNGRFHDVNVFWTGFGDFSWCTDPQTWGVLSLGPVGPLNMPGNNEEFFRSLDWLWFNPSGSTRYQLNYSPTITDVDGFGFCTGWPQVQSIWIEGTEGAACAYYAINDLARGDHFHAQMGRVVSPDGGVPYSFSETNPDSLRYPENWRYDSVAGTAWFYFAKHRFNPMSIDGCLTETDSQGNSHPSHFLYFSNPAVGGGKIDYSISQPGEVCLNVFDARGRLVRTLASGQRSPGSHMTNWDGRDAAGSAVPAGIYLIRLIGPREDMTKKMALLR